MNDSDVKDLLTLLVVIIVIVGAIYFVVAVDFIDCPQCHNTPFFRYLCSLCSGDGKVTLLQYFMYQLRH
jgi:hypothetical protein